MGMYVVFYIGCQQASHTRECKCVRQMITYKRIVKAKQKQPSKTAGKTQETASSKW